MICYNADISKKDSSEGSKTMGINIGYACIRDESCTDSVVKFFGENGCEKYFIDVCESKDENRPQLCELTKHTHSGDAVFLVFDEDLALSQQEYSDIVSDELLENKVRIAAFIEQDFEDKFLKKIKRMPLGRERFEEEVTAWKRYEQTEEETVRKLGMDPTYFHWEAREFYRKRIPELLSKVNFVTEKNYWYTLRGEAVRSRTKYYYAFKKLERLLRNKYNGRVTGLWYVLPRTYEGYMMLFYRVCDDFTEDEMDELCMDLYIRSSAQETYMLKDSDYSECMSCGYAFDEWLENGLVYAVFDTLRKQT